MMEYWGAGALGFWCTGILVHWNTGAHCRCNRKFDCGNLVEFDLSADYVHECNCTRIHIFLSLLPPGLCPGPAGGLTLRPPPTKGNDLWSVPIVPLTIKIKIKIFN